MWHKTRIKSFAMRCLRAGWRDSIAPLFDRWALWAAMQVPVQAVLLYLVFGKSKMIEEMSIAAIATWALIATIPVWFVLNFFRAPFVAYKQEKELGYWTGEKFVFHEPYRVASFTIDPNNSPITKTFKIVECGKNAMAGLMVKHSSHEKLIAWKMYGYQPDGIPIWGGQLKNDQGFIKYESRVGVRLNGRVFNIQAECRADADPIHIKIYMLDWSA